VTVEILLVFARTRRPRALQGAFHLTHVTSTSGFNTYTRPVTTVSLFIGDIADAPAEAICTSTNVRLSLMMGTGASVRERGGWDVLRECEAIVEERFRETGQRVLPHGAVFRTTAGKLPYRAVFHCVASDRNHLTSPELIAICVRRALSSATSSGVRTLAIPVLGSGHARMKFDSALRALAAAVREEKSSMDHVVIVVLDPDRRDEAKATLRDELGERFVATAQNGRGA
jgi:O-acetyl-ADP-ribose deacetylase